ncbi:MAG: ATP cone domain-containing protein [Sedimentisphaerales bacterium]
MKVRLKVVKADGSIEEYLHTKVIGTISNALAHDGQADTYIAEQLADVVTYFLYRKKNSRSVTSDEIFSIIKAVLTATGYEDAAIVLTEHQFSRRIKRSRTEVVSVDIQQLADAEMLWASQQSPYRSPWDKSKIVNDLVTNYNVPRHTARTIASMVEEKIFNIGLNSVPASLVKQLVLGDAAALLRAQQQLQTV